MHSPEGSQILISHSFWTESVSTILYFCIQWIINNTYLVYGIIQHKILKLLYKESQ